MLNSVRYSGLRDLALSVDWLHALAMLTSMLACGPRMMIAAMSTTYDTDMFEPLAIGNCTLNAEVSDDRRIRKTSGRIGVNVARGSSVKIRIAPNAITARMYQRPRGGTSRSKTLKYTFAFDVRTDTLSPLHMRRCRRVHLRRVRNRQELTDRAVERGERGRRRCGHRIG